jgi:UrcA family protein
MFYRVTENMSSSAKRATRLSTFVQHASLAIIGALAMLVQPAFASSDDEIRTRIVRYGDLNLSSVKGQQALEQRIRRAAREVCDINGIVSIAQHRKIRLCTEAAHNKAWAIAQQRIGDYRLAMRVER